MLAAEPTAQSMYAKHRAMFSKQGIAATLKILADPSQIVAALLSGDVEFIATPAANVAVLKSKGAPVKVVAAGATYDPKAPNSGLVSAKGKTIRGARDLVGKTIAIDFPNTIADLGVKEWLERNGVFYSIETPTREMYTQKGNAALSARIDVTVYGSRDPTDRVLNLELKAGMASLEGFRKDFEKLPPTLTGTDPFTLS